MFLTQVRKCIYISAEDSNHHFTQIGTEFMKRDGKKRNLRASFSFMERLHHGFPGSAKYLLGNTEQNP